MIKLFDITDKDFSSNGDAVLLPYKAIVHKEDNGEYYLELETDLKWADSLTANRILAVDLPAGQQAFRIINPVQTGTKITLRANHVFYDSENYLIADSFAEAKTCEQALNQFNNALEPSSVFTVSSDITKIESYRPVRESFKTVIDTMIERWGGHLVRDNWDIQINESIAFDTGITIRYAKNLETIQVEEKWDDVVTKILPVGQDGILLNSVTPSASIYIEGEIDKYPIPFTKAVTFDQNFNSEDYATETAYKNAVIADLRKQAEEYLIKHAVPEVSYTIKAHLDDVYDVGNTIEVIDERLGLNLTTQVTAFDYDCISERFIEIVFGNFKPKLNNLLSVINGTKKFNNVSFSTITNNLNNNSIRLDTIADFLDVKSNGAWSFIKNDKVTIAWARLTKTAISVNISSPAYGGYRSNQITESIPNGIFNETPIVGYVTKNGSNALGIKNLMPLSATSFGFFVWDGVAETNLTLTYSVLLISTNN